MGTSNREAIIQVSSRIASLREVLNRAKDDLKKAEAELDRLLSADSSMSPAPQARENIHLSGFSGEDWEPSLNQQLVKYLDAQPDRQFESDELFSAFPNANQTSIRSALARLADNQKIKRPSRGRYQSILSKPLPLSEAS